MKFPNKPRAGQKTIAALYRSICQIIDYLPTLTVKGDGRSTSVSTTSNGSIISVKSSSNSNWIYKGDYQKYIFGEGVKAEYDEQIISGLTGVAKELLPKYVTLNISGDGTYISASIPSTITDPVIISYIGPVPSGGGGSGSIVYTAGSGISISGNTIQTTFLPGCDIWFWDHTNDGVSPGNYITIENGLSAGFGIKFKDNNQEGDYHMHYIGVDLAGGDYISIVTGTTAGGTPVNYPTIRCNLSATGYIGLSTVYLNQYDTGAIITTNLHGDGTTVTIDNDGTIHSHASGGSGGQTLSAASGINIFASGGVDYIETTFRPGVDIYFWDHSTEANPQNIITIQNGLSAGNGITFRDNTTEEGTSTYHQHYIDWSVSATHWLDYNSGYAVLSCTLTGDGSTVNIANDGTISANVWQYSSGSGISVDNTNHTITLTAQITPGASYSAGSGIVIYTSGGSDYIRTNLEPGCDIYFWDHNSDANPEDRITVQNGLSAGHGISFRDNTSEPGVTTYHQHYMDVNISGGQWLDYNVSAATMSCTLTGDGSTVFINSNGVISARTGTILPTPVANTILSATSNGTMQWTTNTGGSGGGGGSSSQISNGFLFTSGAYQAAENSEITVMLPPVIGGQSPFQFYCQVDNHFVCSDQNPPSAVATINSMLGVSLGGDMHGYWNTTGGDFVVLLPTSSSKCTVRIKGIGSTFGYVVSNGEKIFKYDSYNDLESVDTFNNFADQEEGAEIEVGYYIDYMDIYSSYETTFNPKERWYIHIDSSSINEWSFNPYFFNNIISAITEDGGAWLRFQK